MGSKLNIVMKAMACFGGIGLMAFFILLYPSSLEIIESRSMFISKFYTVAFIWGTIFFLSRYFADWFEFGDKK